MNKNQTKAKPNKLKCCQWKRSAVETRRESVGELERASDATVN